MFIDRARIFIKAGNGGNGCISFKKERGRKRKRPDGGDGGKGGDIIFEASGKVKTLLDFKYHPHIKAKNGEHGSGNNRYGKGAEDLATKVPLGTSVYHDSKIIYDFIEDGQRLLVAKGGKGGKGSKKFKWNPHFAEEGERGEELELKLELKILADVGIIGYPNSGKSTLLAKISSARPKIASYPFTTLSPNLGVVSFDERSFVVADIPGLIEGAHKGKGLGLEFLRHIERTKILIHLLDIFGYKNSPPEKNFKILNCELNSYSNKLSKKPQVVVLNKRDLPCYEERVKQLRSKIKKRVYPISALRGDGLDKLIYAISKKLYAKTQNKRETPKRL